MNTNTYLLPESPAPTKWEQALYAFLAEKHRRTGSIRTVQSYSRILNHFFGRLGKTPDQVVTSEAMAFCFGRGVSGKEPAALTVSCRIATVPAFLLIAHRHGVARRHLPTRVPDVQSGLRKADRRLTPRTNRCGPE